MTKAVSPEPRAGAPAPRVAEFEGGMINAVGLANPGRRGGAARASAMARAHRSRRSARSRTSSASASDEFAAVIEQLELSLDDESRGALDGYELNVSCPNVKAGGMEFGADPAALAEVVRLRARRDGAPDLREAVADAPRHRAERARSRPTPARTALTLVNTIPGLVIDVERRRPALGFGTGGVSGTALLPVGVLATWKVRRAVKLPLMGIGGVSTANDALQYLLAGAYARGHGHGDAARPARAGARRRAIWRRGASGTACASIAEIVGHAGRAAMSLPHSRDASADSDRRARLSRRQSRRSRWRDRLGDRCRFYKVGSELFTAAGPAIVRTLRDELGPTSFSTSSSTTSRTRWPARCGARRASARGSSRCTRPVGRAMLARARPRTRSRAARAACWR